MKSFLLLSFISILYLHPTMAQDKSKATLPYYQITDAPEHYSAGAMLSRMVDGLGYRYYWASDSLTTKDLEYRPTSEARSTGETIEHIYSLSLMILSVPEEVAVPRPDNIAELGYEELRKRSLENFAKASELFRAASDEKISSYKIRFANNPNEIPLWNLINGPIADAIYHTGQIVSFRRISGNPLHPGVSVFRGKTRT